MELRTRIMAGSLLIVILILQFRASFQQESFSDSYSASASFSSVSDGTLTDKQPCSFRGTFLLHKQISRIDSCTECICYNGTTTCRVESCPSDPGCENSERIFSPTECCPRCPGVQSNNEHEFHCFFREHVILQGQTLKLDPCTDCTCRNGTTVCEISSCPALNRCSVRELHFDPDECCPRCQKTTTVKGLSWELTKVGRSWYGKESSFRLDVHIEFIESAVQRGVGMWRVGIFGSSDPAGFGQRYFEVNQTLNSDKASMAKIGRHMDIRNVNFQVGSIDCDRVRYVCVEFAKGDKPKPPFIMQMDNDSEGSSSKSLISCKELICTKRNLRLKVR